jgi:hypothetical protein
MPDDRTISSSRESKTRSDTHKIFSPQQDLRPGNQYLTKMTDSDGDYCVMLCTLPRGVVVPMHSHPDRETFYDRQLREHHLRRHSGYNRNRAAPHFHHV